MELVFQKGVDSVQKQTGKGIEWKCGQYAVDALFPVYIPVDQGGSDSPRPE